ncbi:8334_t:CDS:10 [Cetraspora pellucida]|uniref:8334_t:CDS:1 n=1 Tax=Cetraspora pellucida TaxID=1433469 RepID=A0A9N8ZI16_9GLOM|nr:8334_t:CDS:10 [Cetraspora pellucida]
MSQSTQKTPKLSLKQTFIRIIGSSLLNRLVFLSTLVLVPVGYIVFFLSSNSILVFVINSLAIISSAKLLTFASNGISYQLFRNYQNVIHSNLLEFNFVELIITINALKEGQILVVQAAVIGSICSQILLVFGFCILVGGINILGKKYIEKRHTEKKQPELEIEFSSVIAQMGSSVLTLACSTLVLSAAFSLFAAKTSSNIIGNRTNGKEFISLGASLVLLAIMIVIIVFSAKYLVKSIEGIVALHGISKTFIGLVLLPIVGHGAKYALFDDNTQSDDNSKIKIQQAIIISFESSIQTALLIIPILVIVGWIINQPMSLSFSPFETICLFIAILLNNYLVQPHGSIVNISLSNLVEFIITINALVNGQIRVVQAAMLGSIFSQILLVLGFCFLFGGINVIRESKGIILEQSFSSTVAQMSSSVLTLACSTLILSAAFSFFATTTSSNPIEKPHISIIASLALLVVMTAIIALSAKFLIKSIEGLVTSLDISRSFIGLILLPIVGHGAKYILSTKAARKNEMNRAIIISVGSSTQTALLITPLLVIVGWIINQPMSLFFSSYETIYGKSNWLEGVLLLATYTIVALSFFYYPDL